MRFKQNYFDFLFLFNLVVFLDFLPYLYCEMTLDNPGTSHVLLTLMFLTPAALFPSSLFVSLKFNTASLQRCKANKSASQRSVTAPLDMEGYVFSF